MMSNIYNKDGIIVKTGNYFYLKDYLEQFDGEPLLLHFHQDEIILAYTKTHAINSYEFVYNKDEYKYMHINCFNGKCFIYLIKPNEDDGKNCIIKLNETSEYIARMMEINGLSADEIAHNIQVLCDFIVKYVDIASDFSKNYTACTVKSAMSKPAHTRQ